MNQLLREKQQLQREGIVIRERDITEIQVRIPDCCRNGGVILDAAGREIGLCPHVVQKKKAKKGNIGL